MYKKKNKNLQVDKAQLHNSYLLVNTYQVETQAWTWYRLVQKTVGMCGAAPNTFRISTHCDSVNVLEICLDIYSLG